MEIQSMRMAQKAKELVQSVKGNKEDYLRFARGLGSMFVQNGLAGTLIFLKQKKQFELIEHLKELTKLQTGSDELISMLVDSTNVSDLGSAHNYLRTQSAALESTKWLKRYAEVILGSESNDHT
mgnify:CR=1 FL=1